MFSHSLRRIGFSELLRSTNTGTGFFVDKQNDLCNSISRMSIPALNHFHHSSFHTTYGNGLLPALRFTTTTDSVPTPSRWKRFKDNWFSAKNSWKSALIAMGLAFCSGAGLYVSYTGPPEFDPETGAEIPDDFSHMPKWRAYLYRSFRDIKSYSEPSAPKLLPDPVKPPYIQPRYTLVLEMRDVLLHPDWTVQTGWRFKKRPGVDYLLEQCAYPVFEIVIFTSETPITGFPISQQLDKSGHVMYRLFRDSTRFMHSVHVKDLSYLNRDLRRVIFVDCDKAAFQLQPENSIKLRKWNGDMEDKVLFDLAAFLHAIHESEVDDVRDILEYYSAFDDPIEAFREKQAELKREQERQHKQLEGQKQKSSILSSVSRFTSKR